jgi:hypothetical protein
MLVWRSKVIVYIVFKQHIAAVNIQIIFRISIACSQTLLFLRENKNVCEQASISIAQQLLKMYEMISIFNLE